jgi:hypothetical protein
MANKTYTVVKDGTELKELKTLAAAKKLADVEGAEVLCDGECVYQGTVQAETDPDTPETEERIPEKYVLTRKMNVRKAPSLTADKLGVLDNGAVVEVTEIKDDWLCLTDGSFILYENGKNAKKN